MTVAVLVNSGYYGGFGVILAIRSRLYLLSVDVIYID
jgi:hypothetical protein